MNKKQIEQTKRDAKALENARIISALCNFAIANNWHHVNDYPKTTRIEHEVYVTPTGSIVAFGIDANNEVIIWNKAF